MSKKKNKKPIERVLYFAFGSNLSIAQMKHRCPSSKFVRKGVIKGARLEFRKYSTRWGGDVADITTDKTKNVWGVIYSIAIDDLKILDGYEGYPTCYNRKLVKINGNHQMDICWVYYIPHKTKCGPPSKKYLGVIKAGAHNFNFPKYYREMLINTKIAPKVKKFKYDYTKLLKKNAEEVAPWKRNGKKLQRGCTSMHLPIDTIDTNEIVDLSSDDRDDRSYLLDDDSLWNAQAKQIDFFDAPEKIEGLNYIARREQHIRQNGPELDFPELDIK